MTKDNRLKILQVGSSNWSENQEIPENMKWYYCNLGQLETLQETIEEDEIKTFTAVIVDSLAGLEELMAIKEHLIPHAIFFDQTLKCRMRYLLSSQGNVCCADVFQIKDSCFYPFKALFSVNMG
ncbi:MAG: hypothetical protein ACLUMQ_02550 [Streptococcus salivarius]